MNAVERHEQPAAIVISPRENLLEAAEATTATVPVRVIGLAAYNPNGDPERRGARFAIEMTVAALRSMPLVR